MWVRTIALGISCCSRSTERGRKPLRSRRTRRRSLTKKDSGSEAKKDVRKSSLEARQGRTREVGTEVSQLLQASGCPQPSKGGSAIGARIEEGAVHLSDGEPNIEEAGTNTSPLEKFGRVVESWGGELRRQAEAKAEKWAEASEAHKRNQERRTLEGRQKTANQAEIEEESIVGSMPIVKGSVPHVYLQVLLCLCWRRNVSTGTSK